jgi:hypothetical protein
MTASKRNRLPAFNVPGVARILLQGTRRAGIPRAAQAPPSPWLTAKEAATRAQCGIKLIYREVNAERLQAAKVGGRRELRLQAEWINDWLLTHRVIK